MYDNVNHPKHYTKTSIECIDAMRETQGDEAVVNFCICNAFKYLWRHQEKNGIEDIEKASWYLNKAVDILRGGQIEKTQTIDAEGFVHPTGEEESAGKAESD